MRPGAWPPRSHHCPHDDLPDTCLLPWGISICYLYPPSEDSGLSSPLKLPRLSPWINPRLAFSFYSQTGIISLYDCVFKRDPGYNQNLHRDDREHAKGLGLHINEEVTARGCRWVWTDPLCACLFTFEFSCTKLSCLPIPGRDDQAAVSVPRFCPVKLFIFVTVQSCESESVKSYPILCNPMDCSLPGSSVHGILHSLEWVAIPFSRGSSQPRDWTWVSCIADRCFTVQATREAQPSPIEFNNSMTAKLTSSFRQVNRSLLDLWGLVSRFQGPWPSRNESTWTREIISPELLGRYMHHIWLSSSIIWIVSGSSWQGGWWPTKGTRLPGWEGQALKQMPGWREGGGGCASPWQGQDHLPTGSTPLPHWNIVSVKSDARTVCLLKFICCINIIIFVQYTEISM